MVYGPRPYALRCRLESIDDVLFGEDVRLEPAQLAGDLHILDNHAQKMRSLFRILGLSSTFSGSMRRIGTFT